MLKQKFSFLLWSIWKFRNATVFRNEIFNPLTCLIRAKITNVEWRIRTRMSVDNYLSGASFPTSTPIHLVWWRSAPRGFAKLNFDGSLYNSLISGDFNVRDWTSRLLKVGAVYHNTTLILMIEARALRDSLNLSNSGRF